MQQLQSESSILHFTVQGGLPELYTVWFLGRGMMRHENNGPVGLQERHEVQIRLGAGYPRMMPEIRWKTPIFHPNISGNGSVCLGGYGTYWVPSLTLDQLCHMLWDMIRYENYDETSPYNREAALWAKTQSQYKLPLDARPLRDRLASMVVASSPTNHTPPAPRTTAPTPASSWWSRPATVSSSAPRTIPIRTSASPAPDDNGVIFLDSDTEVVEAEAVYPAGESDILFIQ